ncbi:hypothetical protein BaRGS_00013833, partial [Batillaria attramentaria]
DTQQLSVSYITGDQRVLIIGYEYEYHTEQVNVFVVSQLGLPKAARMFSDPVFTPAVCELFLVSWFLLLEESFWTGKGGRSSLLNHVSELSGNLVHGS